LIVAPLLQFAPDGLWQLIRIFTGFYNIPMIAIVIVGLFTQRVPASAAKLVIVFHILAYGLFQFLFKELLPIHFLHLYAILFVIEVIMMLGMGLWRPRLSPAPLPLEAMVDLTPWAYGKPCAVTLLSCVVALYVTFSPMGLVAGGSIYFGDILLSLAALNALLWLWWYRRLHREPEAN